MKMKTLSLLAGAGGSLLIASSAQADFTGMSWDQMDFSAGYINADGTAYSGTAVNALVAGFWAGISGSFDVWRIYANFSNAADQLTAVTSATTADAGDQILSIQNSGVSSAFIEVAGELPPSISSIDGAFPAPDNPALAVDSWMTIGTADIDEVNPADAVNQLFAVGIPANFGTGFTVALNGGAVSATPTLNDSSVNPFTVPDASGRILIAQLVVAEGLHVSGSGALSMDTAGPLGVEQVLSFSFNTIPAPGAIALLGLAGLVGRPRRRRA